MSRRRARLGPDCLVGAVAAACRGTGSARRELLAGLTGTVCEVGAGPGTTFAYYPAAVERVIAVEPDRTLRRHAWNCAVTASVAVQVRDGLAERLPLEDGVCDAVVFSLVLCSVPNLNAAATEARRVLRPGGEIRFYEHVRSTRPWMARAEDAMTPVWSRLAGGCHPNREPVAALVGAGFERLRVRRLPFNPARGLPAFAHVLGCGAAPGR